MLFRHLTDDFVRIQFSELLRKKIPQETHGGRINFNDMNGSTQTPVQYEATWRRHKNCD